MNCPITDEHLIQFLEEQLTPAQREQLESHLAGCKSCRDLVAEVRLTYKLAVNPVGIRVSENFIDNTVSRLNNKEARIMPIIYKVLKPIAVAASIGFGILIGNGEFTLLNDVDSYIEEESYVSSVAAPADYSVWQSLNEDYGNED